MFLSAATRSSTSSSTATTGAAARPMPRAPAARPSTSRSASPGSAIGRACSPASRPTFSAGGSGGCSRRRGSRPPMRPTDRPTTISLVGLDAAGVPAYQFYRNGSADTGLAPDLPALGPEVAGLHFGSYSIAVAAGRRCPGRACRAGERDASSRLDPNVRPTVVPDMAVWRARIDVLAAPCRRAQDQCRGSRPAASRHAHRRPSPPTSSPAACASSSSPAAATGRARLDRRRHRGRGAPPEVAVVDTVGAGDTFMAAILHWLVMPAPARAAAPGGSTVPA
jgi:fructokinase